MKTNHLNSLASVTETAEFSNNLNAAINVAAIPDNFLNNENPKLKVISDQMVAGIGTQRGKTLSVQIDLADALRDNLYWVIKLFVKGFVAWNHALTNDAANLISRILKAHGNAVAQLNYEKESAILNSVLDDFEKEEAAAALATLNLTEQVAELKAAQENFTTLFRQSAVIEAEKSEKFSPTSLRKETHARINALIDYLNLMNKSDSTTYAKLVSEIANLVDPLNTKIAIRLSKKNSPENTTEQKQ